MGKIFDAYSKRKAVPKSSLRFIVDGERIQEDASPEAVSFPVALERLGFIIFDF